MFFKDFSNSSGRMFLGKIETRMDADTHKSGGGQDARRYGFLSMFIGVYPCFNKFSMNSNVAVPLRLTWPCALALAVGAVYGPQLLMGLFTLAAVDCSHCRATIWKMLAITPGIELLLLPWLGFRFHSPFGDFVNITIVAMLSLLIVTGLALLLRRWANWRWWVFGGVFLLFSFGAFVLLCLIRA